MNERLLPLVRWMQGPWVSLGVMGGSLGSVRGAPAPRWCPEMLDLEDTCLMEALRCRHASPMVSHGDSQWDVPGISSGPPARAPLPSGFPGHGPREGPKIDPKIAHTGPS